MRYAGRYIFCPMVFCGFVLAVLGGGALAHNKSLSFSQFFWQGQIIKVIFSLPARDVTLLPASAEQKLPQILAQHLDKTLQLHQAATPCQQQNRFHPLAARDGYIRVMATYRCADDSTDISITNNAFFDIAGSHVHFARIILDANKAGSAELLFTASQRQYKVTRQRDGRPTTRQGTHSSFAQSFINYFQLGVTHILSGVDHLAFLLCLLLIAASHRHALVLITGFTLGHSITLALSVLSPIVPNSHLVEAMIGGSIAIVAAESILAKSGLMPAMGIGAALGLFALAGVSAISGGAIALSAWAGMMLFVVSYSFLIHSQRDNQYLAAILTVAFGMFHGFGFGGLLLEVGLPKNQLLTGLAGFNLGVEFGQLIVVISAMLVLPYVRYILPPIYVPRGGGIIGWPAIAAAGLTGYGVFLFATRAIF